LTNIAGYGGNLAEGFRQMGHACTFCVLKESRFQYQALVDGLGFLSILRWLSARRIATPRWNLPLKVFWAGIYEVVNVAFFCWALATHDIFIFFFGTSFFRSAKLPCLDYWLLRRMGKKVIHVFQGSDCRPLILNNRAVLDADRADRLGTNMLRQRDAVRKIERHSDWIVSNPPGALFHTRPFVGFLTIGIPFDGQRIDAATRDPARSEPGRPRAVRILHAPSSPVFKGTGNIRETVKRLQAKGHAIDYMEISGQPHAKVIEAIRKCDFIIDQLYSDTLMAGLATEAAYFDKPSVVGCYCIEQLRADHPAAALPPSAACRPEDLEREIERLICDPEYRRKLGLAAGRFVREHWAPAAVAGRFLTLAAGEAPDDWLIDPQRLNYLHGWGGNEERMRERIRILVERLGPSALLLDDKPDLRQRMIDFATTTTAAP